MPRKSLIGKPRETPFAGHQSKVYFVQAGPGGPIKIGIADDLAARVAGLQTANAAKLSLLTWCHGGLPRERELHRQFAALRLHGEWFQPGDELRALIARIQQEHDAPARQAARRRDAAERLRAEGPAAAQALLDALDDGGSET
jgi:sRNA-binding protein